MHHSTREATTAPGVTDTAAALRPRLAAQRELFLLALDGTRIVGTVIGGWDGWRGSIARLAVDPVYRREGIARRLVKHVEHRLRMLGAKRIRSVVLRTNRRGRRFWESADDELEREAVTYIKDLDGAKAAASNRGS